MKIQSTAVARCFLPTVLQSSESYPGPGCNFELFEMVVYHANFKVFKVSPSARVRFRHFEQFENGGDPAMFQGF